MKEQTTNPTHSFVLADVERYGSIEKALLVKEIRNMQIYKLRNGGQGWVYYSSAALSDKFPYMKKESIKRWLNELVDAEVLESTIQNKVKFDRTKSYKLTDKSLVGQNEQWMGQNEPSEGSKTHLQKGQNEPTIPPLSSLSTPLSNFDKKQPKDINGRPDYRGVDSPAKERLREMIKNKQFK